MSGLREEAQRLQQMIEEARGDIMRYTAVDEKRAGMMRDASGRYLLLDAQASLVAAMVALADAESLFRLVDDPRRPERR